MINTTTVQISIEAAERLKRLAELHSKKLGLPKRLSQRDYVEILIGEEEKRTTEILGENAKILKKE